MVFSSSSECSSRNCVACSELLLVLCSAMVAAGFVNPIMTRVLRTFSSGTNEGFGLPYLVAGSATGMCAGSVVPGTEVAENGRSLDTTNEVVTAAGAVVAE